MTESSILDYNPIESILIHGVGALPAKGLIVIVGPNSCGKTQILYDLKFCILGQRRDLVVCKGLKLRKPDNLDNFMEVLNQEGYVESVVNEQGIESIRKRSPLFGLGTYGGTKPKTDLKGLYGSWKSDLYDNVTETNGFLSFFGPLLSTLLFIDNRTILVNEVSNFDYHKNPPENDIQALYMNSNAQRILTEEIKRTFGLAIWLDPSRGNILCLKISDESDIPTPEDRLEPEKMLKHRTIQDEGHGLKSYVGICISLLLGRRPVCLIDEPELCLHPPQANGIGKFIGRYGTSQSHATIVATHSSHTLRGIIEEAGDVSILRLTRNRSEFMGKIVEPEVIREMIKKPITRSETILDGIFSDAVVIVEADGDRIVYEAIYEILLDEYNIDVRFIPVGGTSGFAGVCNFYKKLGIPIAVISDLDLITQDGELKNTLNALTGEDNSLYENCISVTKEISKILPTITENEIVEELREIIGKSIDWTKGDDLELKSKLKSMEKKLYRIEKLKNGGINSFESYPLIKIELEEIIGQANEIGLFLVPVGKLEKWVNELMKNGPSQDNKSEWANVAARRIRDAGKQTNDVWDFVRNILNYLTKQLEDSGKRVNLSE